MAAYIAKRAGMPFGRLICASNTNNVLTDFLSTGKYDRNRDFHVTMSPSMDILISSNLERLLYFTCGAELTAKYMSELKQNGCYSVDDAVLKAITNDFVGYYADETETAQTIARMYQKYHYLCDTHTAVAVCCADKYMSEHGDARPIITASTANPYKFARDVYRSLTGEAANGDLEALEQLNKLTGEDIPYPLKGIGERRVRFDEVISASAMKAAVIGDI